MTRPSTRHIRPHAEVRAERRQLLAAIGATLDRGATARDLGEALGLPIYQVFNHLTVLERDGEVRRLDIQRKVGRSWHLLYVRTEQLLDNGRLGDPYSQA